MATNTSVKMANILQAWVDTITG